MCWTPTVLTASMHTAVKCLDFSTNSHSFQFFTAEKGHPLLMLTGTDGIFDCVCLLSFRHPRSNINFPLQLLLLISQ